MNKEQKHDDWVSFKLKAEAPEEVAFGTVRFAASYRRSEEPFSATRAEWKAFLEASGFFEEVKEGE
jgi:hypothetical protein